MRITSVIYGNPDYYPPMLNGTAVFHEHGITQEILASRFYSNRFPREETPYPSSTQVKRIGKSVSQGARSYIEYFIDTWHLADPNTDLVIGYDLYGFCAARVLASRFRRPLVYHVHDFTQWKDITTRGQWLAKSFEQRFARTADLVILPDASRAGVIRRELGLRDSPLIVANAALEAPDPGNSALRDALLARGKQFSKIVWRQGMIGPGHGIEATLRSIPLWTDQSWGFVIMGPGEERYKVRLLDLASSIGVENQFLILPAVSYAQVAQYTAGADLGHGLYDASNFNHRFATTASNKIMEYIAAGLPVLLSESTGSKELLSRYSIGLTASETSPATIAAAVNSMLGNPEIMTSMRAESRRAFKEEFNYAHQYAPVLQAFKDLTTRRTKSKPIQETPG